MSALRMSSCTREVHIKPVTRLSCSECHREIGEQDVVYRPFFGGYDHLFCATCFEQQRSEDGHLYRARFRLGFNAPRQCRVCARTFVVPRDARAPYGASHGAVTYRAPESQRQHCSQACEAKERRDRDRDLDRFCECCGHDFVPIREDQRYCSPACKQKAYRRRSALEARE
jgi:hypothetical protein